jgi:hypothetical protein
VDDDLIRRAAAANPDAADALPHLRDQALRDRARTIADYLFEASASELER